MHFDTRQLQIHAEHLAGTGARTVRERLARPGATDATTKSSATDYVTDCDPASEASMRQETAEIWGDAPHSSTGEELGAAQARPGELRLIADGVDGTANLHAGAPEYGMSIAIEVDGVVLAGAVAEPVSGRVYSAGRGNGARFYDPAVRHQWVPLNARNDKPRSQRLLATGFSYQAAERGPQAAVVARMIEHVEDVRRVGGAVIDLCRVAQGVFGGYFEHYLNEWDWAAGLLICEEAGAVVNWPGSGGPAAHLGDPIIAAVPEVADDLLVLMKKAGAAALERRVPAPEREWVSGHAH